MILAICPATLPTAPAAPDTTTVSPSFSLPVSSRPKYAVSPVIPSAPRYVDGPASEVSILITPWPSDTAYSCTPNAPYTSSPTAKPGCAEAVTRPTAPARMTAPISTGGT